MRMACKDTHVLAIEPELTLLYHKNNVYIYN